MPRRRSRVRPSPAAPRRSASRSGPKGPSPAGKARAKGERGEARLRDTPDLEAIGRLAGGVAHEFNNLLTAILGYAELLLGRLDPGSPLRHEVEEILGAGERAANLTRELLAFGRQQVLQPRVIELNGTIGAGLPSLRRLLRESHRLATDLSPAAGAVRVDPAQVEQVLVSLVANARDAMPGGGVVTVATAAVDLDAETAARHEGIRPGPHVALSVADTGEGMDEETRARIFEPFFTTKGPGKGTGLGLATVYGIVRQSGGFIAVESVRGRGSRFTILFPRAAEAVPSPERAPGAPGPARGGETVLLAEDEEPVRAITRLVLQGAGYRVLEARDGVEALEVEARHEGPIHLLVSDIGMPRMGGKDLATALAARRPGTRVLLMSGFVHDPVLRAGVPGSGVPFLAKPFASAALLARVREILDAAASSP